MKKIAAGCFGFILFLLLFKSAATAQQIISLQEGKPTSIRGLSVVDDSVAWISGSKGYIATLLQMAVKPGNGGRLRVMKQRTFRDIEAFSATEAVIISSGTPALILKTTNGGQSWQEKYRNTDTTYFFRCDGLLRILTAWITSLGDPIKNKFVLTRNIKMAVKSGKCSVNMPDAFARRSGFCSKRHLFKGG